MENDKTTQPIRLSLLTEELKEKDDEIVHIRIKQRNGKKKWTFIEGLSETIDLKKFVKHLSKKLACGGSIVKDKESGDKVIQFQGNHKDVIKKYII